MPSPASAKPHVLLVDDQPRNLQLLGGILAEEGYRLSAAMDGEQALAMVAQDPPDLILLDVLMPVLDGHATCRRLKSDPATRDIPVIFLTAMAQREDLVDGFAQGAVDYITKPFFAGELISRVRAHLGLRQALAREQALRAQLEATLAQVRRLSGLVPICSSCKKIRDDKGFWIQIETYIREHSEADFTHGVCPGCQATLYPELCEHQG